MLGSITCRILSRGAKSAGTFGAYDTNPPEMMNLTRKPMFLRPSLLETSPIFAVFSL